MTLIPPTRSSAKVESLLEAQMYYSFLFKAICTRKNKKRNRSCEEEDFLPLSKKINNLHINNWGNSHQEVTGRWCNSPDQYMNHYSQNLSNGRHESESRNSSPFENSQDNLQNSFSETDLNEHYKHLSQGSYKNKNFTEEKFANGESSTHGSRVQNNWPTVYNPDLGIEENPYYYESNKLLFGLYIERLQRGGF